jgi:SAM-dependent methyltransferase
VLRRTDQDVGFWLDLTRRAGGPVLELACGTGRITKPLAAAGVEVIGLDVDPAMLARARKASFPLLMLMAADMRRFALARKFAAVIVPYNSFQLLTEPDDAADCLQHIHEHLAPAGVFGLEVTDFQDQAVREEVDDEIIATGSLDGEQLTLSGSLNHDFDSRVSRYTRHFRSDGWETTDVVAIRSYRRAEIEDLLTSNGFAVKQTWQDGSVTRLTATAPDEAEARHQLRP